jgi:hypothetical protein
VIADRSGGSVLDTYFIMFLDRRRPSEEMIRVRCELWRWTLKSCGIPRVSGDGGRETRPFPYAEAQCVIRGVAIKMHSTFRKWETSTESRDTIDSPWTCLLFRHNCAFDGFKSGCVYVVRLGRE